MRTIGALICAIAVSSCTIPQKQKTYEGLQKDSYGSLSNIQLRSCDPNVPASGTPELTKDIVGLITKEINGALTYDQTIVKEDLQDQFRLPADSGEPTVAILERSQDDILFWYDLNKVSYFEVANAANKYCGYNKRKAIPEGSAERCGQPRLLPYTVHGQRATTTPTYVISGFMCG